VPDGDVRVLYVFVVLLHHRRRVVHFNVTDSLRGLDGAEVVEASRTTRRPGFSSLNRDRIFADSFDDG